MDTKRDKHSLMPYFIYKIYSKKQLEKITEFEKFRDAKLEARKMRETLTSADPYDIKIIFAKNDLEAEVLLKEEREARPQGDD